MTGDHATPLVRVEGLTKEYRTGRGGTRVVRAVDGVNLTIATGETLGLVGESGSGKTTLGRAMLRLIEPTAGRVELALSAERTVDLRRLDRRALRAMRRHIQMIFQDPFGSLDPRMTVREIIAEPLRLHRLAAGNGAEVAEVAESVGLDRHHLGQRPGSLSGGQRQRVAVARAIATRPQLIVADEPVSALDVSIQAQILNLLRDLQERLGLSYLFISHDLAVVEHMSDRIAVMRRGAIVETAPAEELLAGPRHEYTR